MKVIYAILLVSIAGCSSSGGGSSSTTTASKSLWSSWTRDDGLRTQNLTGGSLNTAMSYGYGLSTGEACTCTLVATGTEASGNYTMSGCTYAGGGSGDPGCSGLNGTGTYTLAGSVLTICTSANACSSYR